MTQKIDTFLDTTGLSCPEPVMLLHKSVRSMEAGQVIEVLATDPSTLRDIPKFCHFLGHELLSQQEDKNNYRFMIKKLEP